MAKFDESKVKRDEGGRFAQKLTDVAAGAGGGVAVSQASLWIQHRLQRLRARRLGLPEPVAGGGLKRHLALGLAGAVIGGVRDRGDILNTAGGAVRTLGNVSLGAAVGELVGIGAQAGLAAATKGRIHASMFPRIGGALGGGAALALDINSRRRSGALDSGT